MPEVNHPPVPEHMLESRERRFPVFTPALRGMVCPHCEVAWDAGTSSDKCWVCARAGVQGSIYTLRRIVRDSDPVLVPGSTH
jgi:hypothetical protein